MGGAEADSVIELLDADVAAPILVTESFDGSCGFLEVFWVLQSVDFLDNLFDLGFKGWVLLVITSVVVTGN